MTQNFLDGRWQAPHSGATFGKPVPFHPSHVDQVGDSDLVDVEAAVSAASHAFPAWSAVGMAERGEFLSALAAAVRDRRETFARLQTEETGQPIGFSRSDVDRAVDVLEAVANQATRPVGYLYSGPRAGTSVSVRRRPLGVAGIFSPWHNPVFGLAAKLAAALIWGNTAVVKLPELAPRTGLELGHCLIEANVPAGVVNLLTGATGRVGDALVQDRRIRAVTWSGTNRVPAPETRMMSWSAGQRHQQTLGGRNPLVVLADADLDAAADAAFQAAFAVAGQQITATKLIYVQESVHAEFRDLLLQRLKTARIGNPLDQDVDLGPVVNQAQLGMLTQLLDRFRSVGATAEQPTTAPDEGFYLAPTLIEELRTADTEGLETVLGPLAVLTPVTSLTDALTQIRQIDSIVSAALFTADLTAIAAFEAGVAAGSVHINSATTASTHYVPSGGTDESGWGPRENGIADAELYTDLVTSYLTIPQSIPSETQTPNRVADEMVPA